MGGIVIDIWEKSNFFWVIWITKRCQKRDFCSGGALKAAPLMVGLNQPQIGLMGDPRKRTTIQIRLNL